MRRRHRSILLLTTVLVLTTITCGLGGNGGPPRNAAMVNVTANTSLQPWLESAVVQFNEAGVETTSGKPVYVVLDPVESGQAVAAMATSDSLPGLWVPDARVWVNLLADQGNGSYQADCISLARSPLVIAMWRPVAEALGWPGRSLGWLDVGSLAADPSAWAYYSGGQFGETLRLGHTHPGLSGTGASTLLAIVQAAESKTEAVDVADIERPIVRASVTAFEAAVSWFSTTTDGLGRTMRDRGITYLGAAVVYESTVVNYGSGDPAIVPIYPFEGTFVATHPACLNGSADAETREAAELFRAYLLGEDAQRMALASGLRPVNEAVPVGTPLDRAHGVDVDRPELIFGSASVDTIYAVQDLWQSARKDVNLVMLLDTSGSMSGGKMDSARDAAIQFVEQMGDDDYLTLVTFSDEPAFVLHHAQVGDNRTRAIEALNRLVADGNTALYDAIGDGAATIAATGSKQTTNAMVVLTDGLDTSSTRHGFDQGLINAAAANDTTVFTIAYGSDADEDLLAGLARQANGNFYLGDEASIAAIYEEMSAAFGGSVGVGR
jgi:Ca-activated chloride channel family protein